MAQRTKWRLAVIAAFAVLFSLLAGSTAAASGDTVRIATHDETRFMTAHDYYTNVYLIADFGSASQEWELVHADTPDAFFVVNAGDGTCMRAFFFGDVLRGNCGDVTSQWQLIDHPNGAVSFQNVESGLCVDIHSQTYNMWLRAKTCDASVVTQQYFILPA